MTATEQSRKRAIQVLKDKAEALRWNQRAWANGRDPMPPAGLTQDDYALIVELCEAAK